MKCVNMSLKFNCPNCRTPPGYKSLCWKRKAEQKRYEVLGWTSEQITEKQQSIPRNIQTQDKMEDTDIIPLLNAHLRFGISA